MRHRDWGQPSAVTVVEMVSDLDEAQHAEALSWLSRAERERYDSETIGRAERFLAGRWLLRTAVASVAGCSRADVIVAAECLECGREHGAPTAITGENEYRVSLSHAGDVHLVALSLTLLVGVDIEAPRVDVDLAEWTSHEALSKLGGTGLREPRTTPAHAEVLAFQTSDHTGAIAWAPAASDV